MVGTGRGAKRGILIRDIDALQHAERIAVVALDKTGTVTRGRPAVTSVSSLDGYPEEAFVRLAASAEQHSEHPLAQALVRYATARGLSLIDPESFEAEPGLGVVARVGRETVLVGNVPLLEKHGLPAGGAWVPSSLSTPNRSGPSDSAPIRVPTFADGRLGTHVIVA